MRQARSPCCWKPRWKNCGGAARRERKARPLAREQARFDELFAARRADYALAQLKVQTLDKPVKQIAAEIERLLKAAKKSEVEK